MAKEKTKKPIKKPCITISSGTCGRARGSLEVVDAFQKQIKRDKLEDKVTLKVTGCHGFCEVEPNVVISTWPDSSKAIFYQKINPKDAKKIVNNTISQGKIIDNLLYTDPLTGKKTVFYDEIPFFRKQQRLLLGNNALIDPKNINDYLACGGYKGLKKVLKDMKPEEIIAQIKRSGLRGRGGGGFPTGRKWESCRKAHGEPKYIICNADEGDPGTFQDRSILERNPHSVIEGLIIGGYAIGAHEGYIYVRNEYPLAIEHVEIALKEAQMKGFLGKDILGSGFSFSVNVVRGGGAFVCGESSALFASVEGRLGEPRFKHIHATEKGLWDKPTVLNNLKTWATVPLIINKGAEWFAKIGTEKSKGTMIFSLVGKIRNTGLIEVPMGITLRELIYDIGGGIPKDKKFKAVQTGGPSGGCIPAKLLDLPVDYEKLTEAGSMMGSGGMIVMDDDTCMVDIAKYFLSFTRNESCGKCTPCREGTKHMLDILTRITKGRGRKGDIQLLEELGIRIKETSLCALGSSAPNPVLTTIRYFPDEYQAHIENKICPACVCRNLIRYSIKKDKCTGCAACSKVCPEKAISGEKKKPHKIDQNLCIKCGLCLETCKFDAIKKA